MPNHLILTCDIGSGHNQAAAKIKTLADSAGETCTTVNISQRSWLGLGYLLASMGLISIETAQQHPLDVGKSIMDLRSWAWLNRYHEITNLINSMSGASSMSNKNFEYLAFQEIQKARAGHEFEELTFHNTQPIAIKGLVKAVAVYNREIDEYNIKHPNAPQKKHVNFISYVTDAPSSRHVHLTQEINGIDAKDLDDARVKVVMLPPALDEHVDDIARLTEQDKLKLQHKKIASLYPKLYEGLNIGDAQHPLRVEFNCGPIRQEFLNRMRAPADRKDGLQLDFANMEEFQALQAIMGHQLHGDFMKDTSIAGTSTLAVTQDMELTSIMLGSIVNVDSIIELVNEEIEAASKARSTAKVKNVFVFCGRNDPDNGKIVYREVLKKAQEVANNPNLNTRIRIIPLTNQPGSMIADLFSMADKIVTRPGGLSMMEIEAVAKKAQIITFSDISKLQEFKFSATGYGQADLRDKFSRKSYEERLSELWAWEAGNVDHASYYCRDSKGRTRVALTNIFGYQTELDFIRKKATVDRYIEAGRYDAAFRVLNFDSKLNAHFATGNEAGGQLATIIHVMKSNALIIAKLEQVIADSPELDVLDNGPQETIKLLRAFNSSAYTAIQRGCIPGKILQALTPAQFLTARTNIEQTLAQVQKLDIEDRSTIIQALQNIWQMLTNAIRYIFGHDHRYTRVELLTQAHDLCSANMPKAVTGWLRKAVADASAAQEQLAAEADVEVGSQSSSTCRSVA